MRVGGLDAGAIKLRRRQRQLVALTRGPLPPRTLHVEALALAPGAGKGAIDVDVDAKIGALRADLIGGHHVIHETLDKGSLIEIEEGVSGGLRRNGGCRRRSCLSLRDFRRYDRSTSTCRGGAADNGGLEKVAPVELLLGHYRLPASGDVRPKVMLLGASMLLLAQPGKTGSRWLRCRRRVTPDGLCTARVLGVQFMRASKRISSIGRGRGSGSRMRFNAPADRREQAHQRLSKRQSRRRFKLGDGLRRIEHLDGGHAHFARRF